MKVGILTYHRALNYGAFLQAICLCKRLNQEEDVYAEIIDYDMLSIQNLYKQLTGNTIKNRIKYLANVLLKKNYIVVLDIFEAFQRGYEKARDLLSKDSLISDDMDAFTTFVKGKYDVIISGSDEIWKIKPARSFPNPYFLPGDLGCRKFSYAASARMNFGSLPKDQHGKLNGYLKDYEFVSVRDRLTYSAVQKEGISEEKLMLSCDPSFLYDFPENENGVRDLLKGKCKLDPNKKILVLADIHRKTAESIVSQVKDEYNVISTSLKNSKCINLSDLDPFEWRLLISKADMVVSSIFHGVCFCIANNTPFVAVAREDKKSKLQELLYNTELESRYVEEKDALSLDWKKTFSLARENADYRDFVLRQRKNFDIFLEKLRGKND